ncbi:hypothetical protein BCR36DRAFT_404494 [Piromyces finnis]|uniref:Karyogamy protein 5 n=1 Tax=Piromyces finnis TaxID=1754191 RepID=A0A1Y1V9C4_9FUNG|nr:hypothetical protein BCR36DRAFT_404494 [Piromyces finnis]|eukprot:ORX50387.1 hypothetical protein BCR36DRAFT_404494 [Piromyces finnis]
MSKRYEDFLSDNYGIQHENINHDVMTDFDIAINPSNIDAEYVNIYNRAINSFNKYTSKEDCFQNSIKTLKYGCLEMELDDNKKMEYAVELTLCELTSANISIPTECQNNYKTRNMAKCVETISRYNQLWTSYSGYFKDVVNMCYAIRYPLERNLLQNIHRNITKYQFNNMHVIASLYKREFLKIIEISEDYEKKSHLNTLNAINFMKKMNSNMESLNISYDNLINKHNNMEEKTQKLFQTINNSQQNLDGIKLSLNEIEMKKDSIVLIVNMIQNLFYKIIGI